MRSLAALLLACTLVACDDGPDPVADAAGAPADARLLADGSGGDASGAADAAPEAHPLDDFADQVNDAVCDWQVACGVFASKADCLTARPFGTAQLESQLAAGTLVFHPEQAATCVEQLAALADCRFTTKLTTIDLGAPPICVDAFEGKVPEGGACVDAIECTTHACTKPPGCTDACCAGTCGPAPVAERAALGESCADRHCVSGAYCQHATLTCKARVSEGGVCDDALSCVITAICDPDSATVKTCKHIGGHGEACDHGSIVACDRSDDFCAVQEATCTRLPDVGEACSTAIPCLPRAGCVSHVCVALPGAGEACTAGGARCQGTLQCVDGLCTAVPTAACPS